ncbi:hypothetical protein [Planobispora longispora]|uniref:CBM2 domain-containing protein n=1 Tax=Planobispora longispora TaxID=28887 RepID=A0A8J3RRQ4_9ACTN|nr:hypothetical protein [Planobispora longispora]GIH78657.1 hypothetical protein Plo01_50860 [Planobispora longispora]
MGRHGARGDDTPHGGGNGGPEFSAPGPDSRVEPAGRRLRPEESATIEMRADLRSPAGPGRRAETWREELDDPGRERRSGGWLKMTLLAVTAVAAVAGGTVAGVQAWKSSTTPVTDCTLGGCLAAGPGGPPSEPDVADTAGPTGEPDPGREAEPGEEPAPRQAETSPAPTPVVARRDRDDDPQASPRTPRAAESDPPADDPLPTEESRPSEERPPPPEDDDPFSSGDRQDSAPEQTSGPTPPGQESPPSESPRATGSPEAPQSPEPSSLAGRAAVTVSFSADRSERRRSRTYDARVVVTADRDLPSVRLSLPVGGEVISLHGAQWRQEGGTLVIESSRDLPAGAKLVVSFTARGEARAPQSCQSASGECTVS